MIYQGTARYPVKQAILHCAAIKTGQFNGLSPRDVYLVINRWHKDRGFASFGYHGLFMPDGFFYAGRPFTQIGAHVKEANRGTLGFLLIESREITRVAVSALEWFTQVQLEAVSDKVRSIPGLERVSGHNDYANKLCPGFKVKTRHWLE